MIGIFISIIIVSYKVDIVNSNIILVFIFLDINELNFLIEINLYMLYYLYCIKYYI